MSVGMSVLCERTRNIHREARWAMRCQVAEQVELQCAA
jgi:hypothetical protein